MGSRLSAGITVTENQGADRYARRPLVRALDLFVLSVIGRLDEGAAGLMDTWVRRTFNLSAEVSWETGLERQLELGASIRDSLRTMWDGYVDFEAKNGRKADPAGFAMSVVDENFLPLIPRIGVD